MSTVYIGEVSEDRRMITGDWFIEKRLDQPQGQFYMRLDGNTQFQMELEYHHRDNSRLDL